MSFEDGFDSGRLDLARWLPWYLPQWSSRDRSAARYDVDAGRLRLRIDADQEPWCPEWDGRVRVSSLQTAIPPATLGSSRGQHRFHPAAVVREAQPGEATFTPLFGRIELTARAVADPRCMVALWMIGLEDRPEHSGELCVAEIFGRDVRPDRALVGMGIHAFDDPLLTEDFEAVEVRIDVTAMHTYAADWRPDGVDLTIDGRLVRSIRQAPGYPLQLMLGIYEFPPDEREEGPPSDPSDYPKIFEVASVRGYRA